MVSILMAPLSGRSDREIGGRKVWEMEGGRPLKTACIGFDGGLSVGTTKATERLWMIKRLANSIMGIRWPMPGLGIMTTVGGFGLG